MLIHRFLPIMAMLTLMGCHNKNDAPTEEAAYHTSDIDRYWQAYDAVTATPDTAEQRRVFRELYLDPASAGLARLRKERRYSEDEYLENIRRYPKFWASIREQTLEAGNLRPRVDEAIAAISKVYPPKTEAAVYVAIGAFRTGGTAVDSFVLIGAEYSLADASAVTGEFPTEVRDGRRAYYDRDPQSDFVGLIAHEFVHTQQLPIPNYLLGNCLYEGFAEYISCRATGIAPDPAVVFGQQHPDSVRMVFEQEMFYDANQSNWLWSSRPNVFGQRDLGYYVGYAVADALMKRTDNETALIRELIEFDFTDTAAVDRLVDRSGFLSAPLAQLRANYAERQPTVVNVARDGYRFVLTFSGAMDTDWRNFQYGPGGAETALRIASVDGFDEAGITFGLTVEPFPDNELRELVIGPGFRSAEGVGLQPYLITIE